MDKSFNYGDEVVITQPGYYKDMRGVVDGRDAFNLPYRVLITDLSEFLFFHTRA
jgi:hypothetical protein